MSLQILSWDMPSSGEQLKAYGKKSKTVWIPTVLKQPGVKEFRAYRNPSLTSPQVTAHIEFDHMESLMQFLASDDYSMIIADFGATGVTNVSSEIWDGSPVVPEPLRPANS